METDKKIAHLRTQPRSTQCHLIFTFYYNDFVETVDAVRQVKDSIQSLVVHTKNKIQELLKRRKGLQTTVEISITTNGKSADNFSCLDFIKFTNNATLRVNQFSYDLILNAAFVNNVALPKVIFVGETVVPRSLHIVHASQWMCDYEWHKSVDKLNWTLISDKFKYVPQLEDVDSFLKLILHPKNKKSQGITFEIISEKQIQKLCLPDEFPFNTRHKFTKMKLSGKCFRIVNYNILSERYTFSDHFHYCPAEYLSLDYRKHVLIKEIQGYNADVMFFQEVDERLIEPFLTTKLGKIGYSLIYHKKGNTIPEGLMAVYRNDRFRLKKKCQHVLATEILQNHLVKDIMKAIRQNKSVLDRFLKQATSCQITILEEKDTNEIMLLANTHLFYRPSDCYIRLLQIGVIMRIMEEYYKELTVTYKRNPLVLLCGDFNSKPPSGVFEFLTKGTLSPKHLEWQSGEKPIKNLRLKHSFNFESAYGTPPFTNYVDDFKGCLDYIFYDKNQFKTIKTVPLPEEDVLKENVALPSKLFPSDHLALVVDLE